MQVAISIELIGGPNDGHRMAVNYKATSVSIPQEVPVVLKNEKSENPKLVRTAIYVKNPKNPKQFIFDGVKCG